jgi:UDP-N-acetylglucosamine--N-acetylmuramyl-(pentapeptide) pyrophosphoryl-undecaprenol N-acetylglucosamine transferase
LIAGGGTGGHLTPALAVAQALLDTDPGGEVVVVGRQGGVAEQLVTDAGVRLEALEISGLDVTRPASVARAAAKLPGATLAARRLLRRMQPDVVVGAGGYVCVPVVLAALARRVPVVLMEQNAYPGRATRLLARRAFAVATSFTTTRRYLDGANVVETGNPLRKSVLVRRGAPLSDSCRHILVTGGSQGARRLNRSIAGCARQLLEEHAQLRVTHQCGLLDFEEMQSAAASLPEAVAQRYHVARFFPDLALRIAAADLVIMRAGGSSLAECAALGRPMILVPYPHAGAHQVFNAAPYVRAGAALLLDDEACTPARLRAEINKLVGDQRRWHAMAAASLRMGRPDATERVTELIGDAVQARGRRRVTA